MIFPYSFSYMTLDGLRIASEQAGKSHSIRNTDPVTPASLCGAMGLKDWKTAVEDCKGELGHFYISFYIETEDIYGVLSLSESKLLKLSEGCYVLTDNVLGWRNTVVNGLSKDTSKATRQVANYILAYLRDNGFGAMFAKYKRTNLAFDGTIILEEE